MAELGNFLNGRDTISSKSGSAYMHVDGKIIPLIEITKAKAKISKKKTDIKTLNTNWTQKKTTGLEGSGSLEYYVVNSNWIKYAMPLLEDGADLYFDMTIEIEDKTSRAGKQSITLTNVNVDDVPLFDLEADDSVMKESSDFSFVGVHLDKAFDDINK